MNKTKLLSVWVVGVVVTTLVVLASLWTSALYLPRTARASSDIYVEIKPGSSVRTIADTLQSKGIISSPLVFTLYARMSGKGDRLIPGTYAFRPTMSIPKLVKYLASGRVAARTITVPEGYTVNRIAELWRGAGLGSAEEFTTAAKQTYNYSFLPSPTADMKYPIEGYLLPLTYNVAINATPQDFINQMLRAFELQALPIIEAARVKQTPAQSVAQIVTLASIVELEANDPANRAKVAGVFDNRMARGMALESDVTVIYVTGRTDITAADLRNPSPYNTRLRKGLPPGPICNPGLEAINAVLNPTKSDYIFFLAGTDGEVYYAKTLLEHNQNIARYLK